MVGNKRPIPLQQQINSDGLWERLLQRRGLVVVDVYSEWCGPCVAMVPNLKQLKRRLGGGQFHLAVAKSDNISHLERFRDRSEPTWIFLVDGKMVNVMYGANAPRLIRLITSELNTQVAVKEGKRERVEIELAELPKEEVLEEKEPVEEIPVETEEQVILSDEDFMYRPF